MAITGIEVPLEAAMAAWLAALALGVLAGRLRLRGKPAAAANDPLAGLFTSANLGAALDAADRRTGARAVLHGRIDQLATLHAGWDAATRARVLGQIAGVMKAGVRREDAFTTLEGDGFTILMPGADEQAARGVAERLRRALAGLHLPQFGRTAPFSASFGVAAERQGESRESLVARARTALRAAQKAGGDHVVAASEIEEVMFLPAPEAPAQAA
ncbi:MAG: diguanylate cyclase [Porphyrobacter sp.]|nr:diguanylate cyclase [Porphyrobacter sp.]